MKLKYSKKEAKEMSKWIVFTGRFGLSPLMHFLIWNALLIILGVLFYYIAMHV